MADTTTPPGKIRMDITKTPRQRLERSGAGHGGSSSMTTKTIEVKLCECGCGEPAPIAKYTDTPRGRVKGQPLRFVSGHHRRPTMSVSERFWSYVDKSGECWLWTRSTNNGYGRFYPEAYRRVQSHRFAYEDQVGPIPKGLEIDHLCRNRACVNPAHLEPVTPRENQRRGESPSGKNARKTHCIHGHEFTPENTYRAPGTPHKRQCRECARIRESVRVLALLGGDDA